MSRVPCTTVDAPVRVDWVRLDGVGRLVGTTRALILAEMARHRGVSTTELAEYCQVSMSSVSEHVTTLRVGGLCETHRARTGVRHAITELGLRLLLGC